MEKYFCEQSVVLTSSLREVLVIYYGNVCCDTHEILSNYVVFLNGQSCRENTVEGINLIFDEKKISWEKKIRIPDERRVTRTKFHRMKAIVIHLRISRLFLILEA